MNNHFVNYHLWFTVGVSAFIALMFIALGLRGLVTRRPFLFPSRIMFVLVVIAFLPILILPFESMSNSRTPSFDVGMPPLIIVVFLVMSWVQVQGYMIYGISAEAFRNCLRRTLDKLRLPYQESFSSIRLESIDADLQASVQDWMGRAQIRIKPSKHAKTLVAVAKGLREEFPSEKEQAHILIFIAYTLIGLMILAIAYHLTTLLW